MIINEIVNIFENSKTEDILGTRLNNLYDEFRGGRNPYDIIELLTHSDNLLVWHGCAICCEIIVRNYDARSILITVLCCILKDSKDSANREQAFSALFGFYLDEKDVEGFNKICIEYKDDVLFEISNFATNFLKDSSYRRV
jgi:hypothetical protein